MFQPIRGDGGHFRFPIRPQNTNLVEDIEFLLHVKFRWIPLSGFREVENVSANQRSGRPSYFSICPKKKQHWQRPMRSRCLSIFGEIPFSCFRKCYVNDGWTTDNAWSQKCIWALDAISNLRRDTNIDASYMHKMVSEIFKIQPYRQHQVLLLFDPLHNHSSPKT